MLNVLRVHPLKFSEAISSGEQRAMNNSSRYWVAIIIFLSAFLKTNSCLIVSRHIFLYCLKTQIHSFCLIVLISLSCLSCNSQAPSECKQLCGLSNDQQYSVFTSYSPEKQFDLYVNCKNEKSCWNDSESRHDYYGQWMAENKKALPLLLERLQSENDERVQQDILYVLRFMAVNGQLKGESNVPKVVNRVVENMRGSLVSHFLGGDRDIERAKKWAKEIESSTK